MIMSRSCLLVILSCLLFLSACSSTKVHVNERYLSQAQREQVRQILETSGYEVESNVFRFPSSISQSTLLYSPMISDKQAVNNVLALLAENNWHVPGVRPLVSGKHWFTRDSVGLYLLPEEVNPHNRSAIQDLANTYEARHCETQARIVLHEDQQFEIILDNPPADLDHRLMKGKWRMPNYPVIELVPGDDLWPWYFELSQSTESDQVSSIEITELSPLDKYKLFPGCKFAFGNRV